MGKKPPLTKAEKAKKQRDEAERKAKEEEEAKIRSEKEEIERIERERLEADERNRQDKEEKKKIKWQIPELEAILTNNRNTLNVLDIEARKAAQWARYMRCDGSPDPTILPEINMYMSLWREDREHTDAKSILKESELVLQLIDELEDRLEDKLDSEMNDNLQQQYKTTILELQQILKEKLDLGTHDLLLKASSLAAPDMDLTQCMQNDFITLCIWVNLSKNPRVKSFDFDVKGMVFELNAALNRCDCVVRALFTKFDHLSHLSKSYYPLMKKKAEPEPIITEEPVASDGKVAEVAPIETETEEKKEVAADEIGGKSKSTLGFSDSEEEDVAPPAEERPKSVEDEDFIDLADFGLVSPEPIEYEDFDAADEIVDLRAYHVIGGIFHIDLLHIPPQPKVIKNWTVTILVEPPELSFMEYEISNNETEQVAVVEEVAAAVTIEGSSEKLISVEKTPLMVMLRLPDDVCFCEEPEVVRFDSTEMVWRKDGLTDKMYNESTRQLTFRMHQFGTMALMQDAHINMPFQSWELRPRSVNHAQLTIIAPVLEVEFQIKDGLVCMSQPEDKPELTGLLNKYMPVHKLIREMKYAGVNVFPSVDSYKYVKIPNKNLMAEDRFYKQAGLVGSAVAFSWSKWNTEVQDRERIVVQGARHLEDQPLLEEDWSLILVTKRRMTKLKMTEFSETFSDEHAENTDFHSNLYHLTMEIANNELAKQRIHQTSAKFSEALYQLLRLTRVIVYS